MENEERVNIIEQMKLYIYYILIAVISVVSLIIFPIIGSAGNDFEKAIKTAFPSNKIGWIIWAIARILIVILNLLIFSNFIQQSKVNIKENKNYIAANNILARYKTKDYKPRSPKQYLSKTYATKGLTLTFTTVVSLFAIGSAVINYDLMLLLATTFTIIMSVVFGIMTMKKCELYYITEYYDYALLVKSQVDDKIKLGEEINNCLENLKNNLEVKND